MDISLANVTYASFSLVVLFSLSSLWRLCRAPWRVNSPSLPILYEDEDGVATEESMARFSNKRQFVVIFFATPIGIAASFGLAVWATVLKHSFSDLTITQLWLLFASWLLMLAQLADTARVDNCVERFNRAYWNAYSSVLIFGLGLAVLFRGVPTYPENAVLGCVTSLQILAALVVTCGLVSIERRPDVYSPEGTFVERQFKASLWARYTYSWSSDILDLAATKLIDITDMPALDSHIRSKEAKDRFRDTSLKPTVKLWILIFWNLQAEFYWQWFLITISCFFDVAPQYAMLELLRFLEDRQDFNALDPKGWVWVGVMFLVTVGSTLIDYRIFWHMMTDIAIPLRSILTALIFEKMMRIKDTKEPPSENKADEDGSRGTEPIRTKPSPRSSFQKPKTQQDVVNMFAVDTNLIGIFAGNQQFYLNFAVRVVLAIAFLWLLVGWVSMLAGMSVMLLMYPANHFLGKRYAGLQKQLMEARDTKTKVITEALNGIRQIKFSSIEPQWAEKIETVREKELDRVWKTKVNNVLMGLISDLSPVLFAAFALATYSFLHGSLLPSIAFTALSLFMQLEGLMHMIPMLLTMGVNAKVSADRIDAFLQIPDKEENTYPGESISFNNVAISFPSNTRKRDEDDRFVLRDITLDFPNGALSVISGPTGSGKSLLLAAILGEADVLAGDIRVPRPPPLMERFDSKATAANWILPTAKAYVAQTPWIENATIKNNILFGLPYDPVRYEKVVEACALTKDLAMFEDGDSTEVGAQGISLSGGQKWRLTLARAFYSRAGILILDDVFSALDAHVGKEIYENALMGELSKGRTRILVTHHVSLCLPRAKYAARLGARGTLDHAGLTEHLRETGSLTEILNAEDGDESSTSTLITPETTVNQTANEDSATAVSKGPPKKLVEDEARESGSVKSRVYLQYLKASGGFPFWTMVVFVYILSQALTLSRSWWVKIWTSSSEHAKVQMIHITHKYSIQTQFFTPDPNSSMLTTQAIDETKGLGFYLSIYIAISLVAISVGASRIYLVYRGSLKASRMVFKDMTYSVLRTPLRWLDTVPTGRILNRFTADFQLLDSQLSMDIAYVAGTFLELMGILAAAFFISPFMIILAIFLFVICAHITRRYLRGARSIKRLESIQKSPAISLFSSSYEGLSTIRAFDTAHAFESRMYSLIDQFATSTWHNALYNNWVGYNMSLIGCLFSSAVSAFVVSTPGVEASLAGFALAFSMDYRQAANTTIRIAAQTELDMNAAERIFEYSNLATENQGGIDNLRASWPEEGKLEVTGLEVGYAEDLPSILKGLTFKVDSNQRIGVVGRTGAGKSTLSLALFRFLEARKGSIVIDGVDISTIKLHDLRTRLAIIPQDPVLFSGTIRSNLDPFDNFSDHELIEVLRRVHLIPSSDNTPVPELTAESSVSSTAVTLTDAKVNANVFNSLSSPISAAGSNLSQGQKQLLCLARAILSRPRLLILDEATSAVDMATDTLIQRSIREEFANTTLLVVAHRLSTVADFDRILVMRDGQAEEFGTPRDLIDKEEGLFKDMVAQSGEQEELERTIRGQ